MTQIILTPLQKYQASRDVFAAQANVDAQIAFLYHIADELEANGTLTQSIFDKLVEIEIDITTGNTILNNQLNKLTDIDDTTVSQLFYLQKIEINSKICSGANGTIFRGAGYDSGQNLNNPIIQVRENSVLVIYNGADANITAQYYASGATPKTGDIIKSTAANPITRIVVTSGSIAILNNAY